MSARLLQAVLAICFAACPALPGDTPPPQANIAAFADCWVVDKADPRARVSVAPLASKDSAPVALEPGTAVEIVWRQPRAVREVLLHFTKAVPAPSQVSLEWWRRIWPDNGTGGWMKLDDPFNGDWTAARATAVTNGTELRLRFKPLDTAEAPGVKNTGHDYRLTYKLRVSCKAPATLAQVEVFSDAVMRTARVRFEWGLDPKARGRRHPAFEARNGRVLRTTPAGNNAAVVEVEYADSGDRLSADRGHLVFRNGETNSFAVFVDEVIREGGLLVRDIGVYVSDAARNLSYKSWSGPAGEVWKEGTVSEQVSRMAEQSFEQVSQAIRQKPPRYLLLGVPNLRQEIALLPDGSIQLRADSLRSQGPDTALRPWRWPDLTYQFGVGEHPRMGPQHERQVKRSLEEGWLPVVRHEWQSGPIRCVQTSLATTLATNIAAFRAESGAEPVVLVAQFELCNTDREPQTAWLWMELSHTIPCRLAVGDILVLDYPSDGIERRGLVPLRGRFQIHGKGALDIGVLETGAPGSFNPELRNSAGAREAVRYRIDLEPGQSHAIELAVPYVELLDAQETEALKSISFASARESVIGYWKDRVDRGMTYRVPDVYLNQLFKANLWHVLISTDIDPATGHHQHGAATVNYRNFLNETAMVARSLEMRGEHEAAFRLIEPFLACQGVKPLPGNFTTQVGVLYAAHPSEPDPYTAQGYNMHHGWGLWAAAEHFFWTRDAAYLTRCAPQLILAADWIVRERQATKFTNPNGTRPVEFGLAPAGDLEDVEEYLYFYATDAYYHLGLKQAAAALGQLANMQSPVLKTSMPPSERKALAQHARRLTTEADRFLTDIRASVAESVATSPVVRLKDGSHVPFVPPRAYALTHLKEGWIREGLYPALHLVNGQVYDERHPFVEWMIHELEDNVFLSRECGYGVEDQRSSFYNLGGFTLQPNLLDLAIVCLKRDQVPNFLRAFYNTAWVSIYPDAMCFAEWVPKLGEGAGPLYKTPDECKFIQWMRQMLVLERGDMLELGLGVPRRWMTDGKKIQIQRAATYFGKLDLEIISQAAEGRILANARLASTVRPKAVSIRLRHPEGRLIRSAKVNGRPATINAARQLIQLPAASSSWEIQAFF